MNSPDTLSHLVEFTPAEIRIFSLDSHLQPWHITLERLHKPSRIGASFAGIVRIVDTIRRTASLDIGEPELAHLTLPRHTPIPHIGQRIIVQCKREAYQEKAPLMSIAHFHRSRYLELRSFPHAWFPPENHRPKNTTLSSHISQKPELQDTLSDFAQHHFAALHIPAHSLEWQFTPMATLLYHSLSHDTKHFHHTLLHDLNLLLAHSEHKNEKEKGLIKPPPSPLHNLFCSILPQDTLSAFGSPQDLQNLEKNLSHYPELSLSSSHDILSLHTTDILDTLLAPSHSLSGNAHIHIEHISTLTAIDIDSGTPSPSPPASLNAQALSLIPRLIHAQNLSGLIVIDPLSSPQKSHIRHLVNSLRAAMKTRHPLLRSPYFDILGATHGGLIEITRQRLSPPLSSLIHSHTPKPSYNLETQACNIIQNLARQAILTPQSLLNHQPLSLPQDLISTLNSQLINATKKLQKQWDGITLWNQKNS